MSDDGAATVGENLRGFGLSTASCLKCIAFALENPNTWVTFRDHEGEEATRRHSEGFAGGIEELCQALKLASYEVDIHNGLPRLRFTLHSRIPGIYKPAELRCVLPEDRGEIGVGFDLEDGSTIRLRISTKHAQSIRQFRRSHSEGSSGIPRSDVSINSPDEG